MLVAGVTGGASLIESAKVRATINDLRNYKTMFYTFRAAKDRMLGDYDNAGFSGWCKGSGCPGVSGNGEIGKAAYSNFGGEYNGIIVGTRAGPWVELYLEGISNFKPYSGTGNVLFSNVIWGYGDKNFPCIKYINGACASAIVVFKNRANNSYNNHFLEIVDDSAYIEFEYNTGYTTNTGLESKILKKVDEKFDDGKHNSGGLRSECGGPNLLGTNTYNIAIDNNAKCRMFYYKIDKY